MLRRLDFVSLGTVHILVLAVANFLVERGLSYSSQAFETCWQFADVEISIGEVHVES